MNPPVVLEPAVLPNLDELPERLQAKFRAMNPEQFTSIFTTSPASL